MSKSTGASDIVNGLEIRPETRRIVEELKRDAIRRSGFDDFGPSDFEDPLAMIVEEGAHKPGGDLWKEEVTLALIGRLVREASWKANPGYKDRKIVAPLIICGIPRTGTTALHKVLSMDPQFQGLDHWLASWPKPRPPREQWPNEAGFKNAVEVLKKRFADQPIMEMAHHVAADEVDECLEVLRLDLVSNRFPSMTALPRFDAWYQRQDETPYYLRLADTLRLIGINDDRPWLLKNPGHFGHIKELLTAFPDARVVITHRDPAKSLASLCSILTEGHRALDPDEPLEMMGRREFEWWAVSKEKTEAERLKHPAEQFFDVDHLEFHRDPIGIVRRIYDHFGLKLASGVESAMREWLAANPSDKRGTHRYSLEGYGLTAEMVRERYGTA